jgi:hypothetical protein
MGQMGQMGDKWEYTSNPICTGINWLENGTNGRVSLNTRPICPDQSMPKLLPKWAVFSFLDGAISGN